MDVLANATSFASPLANADLTLQAAHASGVLGRVWAQLNSWTVVLTILLLLATYDQCSYQWRKHGIVGPAWKMPFIGPFLESMRPDFRKYKEKWESAELSCVSVFHKFVVIAGTRDMARKVFNSPGFVKPTVVDVAPKLLRPTNWVFLDGKAHVEYRKGLNGLFTRQALEMYLPGQEEVYSKYFKTFLEMSKENNMKATPWMPVFRELMCAVSCRTFVGHYMSEKVVKKIAHDYYLITAALELVNFPIIIPYTKTWYGKKAADMVLVEFAKCAAKSKVRMAAGGSITCILDAWVKQIQDSAKYRERIERGEKVDDSEKPPQLLRDFTDFEISQTVFTFLFASQDATSSACTWLFQIMADRPEILDKVREENLRLRGGDRNKPFDMDMLESMVWTRAVVKETLRYRPPVILVPYVAKKDFPVTEGYTLKKGSMIIPSIWPATHDPEAYPNPDSFEPERWITGDADKQVKNWLVFGTGPHYCLGQTYAQLNLMAMIGKASILLDWEHEPTPISEDIEVFATIFPQTLLLGLVNVGGSVHIQPTNIPRLVSEKHSLVPVN
ncbi:Cytochrome P450 61 [Fonsecaea pedrosoi]|nr:Cytochrome P450 61 [Fonsecaea pedrosoi]